MRRSGPLEGVSVLTTDAEKRIGLYAVRYLGRAGARVSGIARADGDEVPIAFLSRYIQAKILFHREHYFEDLKEFLKKRSRDFAVINPIDISQMLCIMDADREHRLGSTYLLPCRESLVTADNKELLVKHAEKTGLRCPRTYYRLSPARLRKLCREITFPCIIKFRGDNRETHWRPEERYSIVHTPRELLSEYGRMHAIEPYPVLQEYIKGRGFGYFALYDRARRLKAQFCHRRIREYPTNGGPSSCCESIHDPELVRIGRRLLESLEWTGLAMVEFKFDEVRKEYFIIEVNPRYWGSLPLAVESGVNFPVLHTLSALDREYEPVLEYRLGVKVRFYDRDVRAIMALVRSEKNNAEKIRLLLDMFNPTIRDGLVNLDDPGPFIGRILHRKRSHRAAV